MKILYEDKYLLVCEKPVGVESQASSNGKENMLGLLSRRRQERGEDSYVGLVHRLDTATGGAMNLGGTNKTVLIDGCTFTGIFLLQKLYSTIKVLSV